MNSEELFEDGPLALRLVETDEEIRLEWRGMSMAREPGQFLLPVLSRVLERGSAQGKPVVIDFQNVEYLNSSTMTPVIRTLEQARRGKNQVRIVYKKDLKWQALSFTALELFRTQDSRIDVRGI